MTQAEWKKKFLANTRAKIVTMLRGGSRTVGELAGELALTENAIRQHLSILAREGIVQQKGARPGIRKPHLTYQLTLEADQLFPKAYGLTLLHLLSVMTGRFAESEVQSIMRDTGVSMAGEFPVAGGTWEERLDRAVEIYDALGGLAVIERMDGMVFLRGDSCPVASVVDGHPEICIMLEELLSDVIKLPVRSLCQREPKNQCCFEITPP